MDILITFSEFLKTQPNYAFFVGPIFGAMATMVAASIAAVVAFFTIRASRLNQDRKQAFEAYDNYLKDCMENPKLSYAQIDIPKSEIDRKEIPEDFLKYEWFVERMLGACEQILSVLPRDEFWLRTVENQISFHSKYFNSNWFDGFEFRMYTPDIRRILLKYVERRHADRLESAL